MHISHLPCAGTSLPPAHSAPIDYTTLAAKNTPCTPNMPPSFAPAESHPLSLDNPSSPAHYSLPDTKTMNDCSVLSLSPHSSDISPALAVTALLTLLIQSLLVASALALACGPSPAVGAVSE